MGWWFEKVSKEGIPIAVKEASRRDGSRQVSHDFVGREVWRTGQDFPKPGEDTYPLGRVCSWHIQDGGLPGEAAPFQTIWERRRGIVVSMTPSKVTLFCHLSAMTVN